MADDFSVAKLAPAVVGAMVSLKYMQGTYIERLAMAVGGAALSYYGTTPVAVWSNAPGAEGLIGFAIGLFGMSIVAKCYEIISLIDAKQAAIDLWATLKRKWGA
jgi:hypothetical protein